MVKLSQNQKNSKVKVLYSLILFQIQKTVKEKEITHNKIKIQLISIKVHKMQYNYNKNIFYQVAVKFHN